MGRAFDWRGWADAGRRIATAPYAPVAAVALLALLGVAESIARFAFAPGSIGRQTAESATRTVRVGVSPHITHTAATAVSSPPTIVLWQLWLLCLLCLFTTLPLAFVRPAAAAVAIAAASVLSLLLFQMLTVAGAAALLIALYRLGHDGSGDEAAEHGVSRHGGSRRGAEQLLAVLLGAPFLVLALTAPADSEARVVTVLLAALAPAAALAGIAQRARAEALETSVDRQALAGTLLEHAARGERARIVRELHDIVAHHISMVAVQAETARVTTPGMPAAGAQRLSAIGDTARAALTEMRRLLGVLREDTETNDATPLPQPGLQQPQPELPQAESGLPQAHLGPPQGQPGLRQPQPGLRQLNELLDEAREASGAGLRLIVSGPPAELDPGVELAAYRIVQEALTNSRRHAPGAAVDVELRYADDALRMRIRDNGPGPPIAPPAGSAVNGATNSGYSGHGLLGMRERAAAVGGELRTGPASGGGFLIEARLPAKLEEAR